MHRSEEKLNIITFFNRNTLSSFKKDRAYYNGYHLLGKFVTRLGTNFFLATKQESYVGGNMFTHTQRYNPLTKKFVDVPGTVEVDVVYKKRQENLMSDR